MTDFAVLDCFPTGKLHAGFPIYISESTLINLCIKVHALVENATYLYGVFLNTVCDVVVLDVKQSATRGEVVSCFASGGQRLLADKFKCLVDVFLIDLELF